MSDEEYPEDDDIEESFFSFFIDGILPLHKAKDKAVRLIIMFLLITAFSVFTCYDLMHYY